MRPRRRWGGRRLRRRARERRRANRERRAPPHSPVIMYMSRSVYEALLSHPDIIRRINA